MSRKRNENLENLEVEAQTQDAETQGPEVQDQDADLTADLVWVRNPSGTLDVFVRGSVWHKYALEHGGEETEAPDGG